MPDLEPVAVGYSSLTGRLDSVKEMVRLAVSAILSIACDSVFYQNRIVR